MILLLSLRNISFLAARSNPSRVNFSLDPVLHLLIASRAKLGNCSAPDFRVAKPHSSVRANVFQQQPE